MFDPDAHLPRINRGMVYLGACLIAGIRLARERQVNVRVIPTSTAINESVDLAYEIHNRVFRKVPERVTENESCADDMADGLISSASRSGCKRTIRTPHDVTCIAGRRFSPCKNCEHPRFTLKMATVHIAEHQSFK
jgi:hypothetical protein